MVVAVVVATVMEVVAATVMEVVVMVAAVVVSSPTSPVSTSILPLALLFLVLSLLPSLEEVTLLSALFLDRLLT